MIFSLSNGLTSVLEARWHGYRPFMEAEPRKQRKIRKNQNKRAVTQKDLGCR